MTKKKSENSNDTKVILDDELNETMTEETAAQQDQPELLDEEDDEEISLEEALATMTKAYADLEKEKLEIDNKLLRLQADFDNFRKRTRTEKDDWRAQIVATFCGNILPVLDNFHWAILAMTKDDDKSPHLAGIQMIAKQLEDVLSGQGVERIATVGMEFDPKYHEAIGQVPVDDAEQIGRIIDESQAGYKIGERVIRVAMVRVGVAKAEEA